MQVDEELLDLVFSIDAVFAESDPFDFWHFANENGWDDPFLLLDKLIPLYIFSDLSQLSESLPDVLTGLISACMNEFAILVREKRKQALQDYQELEQNLRLAIEEASSSESALLWILKELSERGFPLAKDLAAKARIFHEHQFNQRISEQSEPSEPVASLRSLIESSDIDNEFDFFQIFTSHLTHLPEDVAGGIVVFWLTSEQPIAREAAIFSLLHPDVHVREEVRSLLLEPSLAAQISPVGLRRLINMRNWFLDSERTAIDKVIRNVRKAGVNCSMEQAATAKVLGYYQSTVDGAGAQTLMIALKEGRRFRLFGAVLKEHFGVLDTWMTPPSTRKEIDSLVRRVKNEIYTLEVDQALVEAALGHFLQYNAHSGQVVSPEVLQIFEMTGIESWNPQALDFKKVLEERCEHYIELQDPEWLLSAWHKTGQWHQKSNAFAVGWFEHSDELVEFFEECVVSSKNPSSVFEDKLLADFSGEVGRKWFKRLVYLGLWAEHNQKKRGPDPKAFYAAAVAIEKNQLEPLWLVGNIIKDSFAAQLAHHA